MSLTYTGQFKAAGQFKTGDLPPPPPAGTTWNGSRTSAYIVSGEGNLDVQYNDSSNHGFVRAEHGMTSGKYYWEVQHHGTSGRPFCGIVHSSVTPTAGTPVYSQDSFVFNPTGYRYHSNSNSEWGFTWSYTGPSNRLMFAVDMDNDRAYAGVNGSWYQTNSTNIANSTTNGNYATWAWTAGTYYPVYANDATAGTWTMSGKFEADSWLYTAPAGYEAIIPPV